MNDGSLLFLQHMIAKFEPVRPEEHKHGSRLAIVFSGSPLFTGGAGSGESNIRRWIIENDWLEAVIALPEQMFYNTGIGTYVWIVTNRKEKRRRGRIQLLDARDLWPPGGSRPDRLAETAQGEDGIGLATPAAGVLVTVPVDQSPVSRRDFVIARDVLLRVAVGMERVPGPEQAAAPLRGLEQHPVTSRAGRLVGDTVLAGVRLDSGTQRPIGDFPGLGLSDDFADREVVPVRVPAVQECGRDPHFVGDSDLHGLPDVRWLFWSHWTRRPPVGKSDFRRSATAHEACRQSCGSGLPANGPYV